MSLSSVRAVHVHAHRRRLARNHACAKPLIQANLIGKVVDVCAFGRLDVALVEHLQRAHICAGGRGQDVQALGVDDRRHVIAQIRVDEVDHLRAIVHTDYTRVDHLIDDRRRELLCARCRGKARLIRQFGNDSDIAQQRHRARAHPVLDLRVQCRLDNTGTGRVKRCGPAGCCGIKHLLNVLNLLDVHLIGGIADQVGHLHSAGAQFVDVDHRPGRYGNCIQRDLLVRDLAARWCRALGLNERGDAFQFRSKSGLLAITDALYIRHMREPVGLRLDHLVDRIAHQLRNLILVVRGGIRGQLRDLLRGLLSLVGIHFFTLRLCDDQLDQLAVASDFNRIHIGFLPSSAADLRGILGDRAACGRLYAVANSQRCVQFRAHRHDDLFARQQPLHAHILVGSQRVVRFVPLRAFVDFPLVLDKIHLIRACADHIQAQRGIAPEFRLFLNAQNCILDGGNFLHTVRGDLSKHAIGQRLARQISAVVGVAHQLRHISSHTLQPPFSSPAQQVVILTLRGDARAHGIGSDHRFSRGLFLPERFSDQRGIVRLPDGLGHSFRLNVQPLRFGKAGQFLLLCRQFGRCPVRT
nr:MAG TPA: hypothetical protein [Bacteriophage sp.]